MNNEIVPILLVIALTVFFTACAPANTVSANTAATTIHTAAQVPDAIPDGAPPGDSSGITVVLSGSLHPALLTNSEPDTPGIRLGEIPGARGS